MQCCRVTRTRPSYLVTEGGKEKNVLDSVKPVKQIDVRTLNASKLPYDYNECIREIRYMYNKYGIWELDNFPCLSLEVFSFIINHVNVCMPHSHDVMPLLDIPEHWFISAILPITLPKY
ncbi:uncharacterized protein LOC130054656 [Ostrea edulis]|uniref:uncharacterized protein LOC130054656 n=1 Tax=Ostrea edulis TaxID=37623 RepID=UPI0024AF4F2D|nr:uncharacterized protein LOC130054656 [Ostrea edulis]